MDLLVYFEILTTVFDLLNTEQNIICKSRFKSQCYCERSYILGEVSICPAVLRQYTQEDGGALTQYGSYCYELVTTKVVWKRAAIDCMSKGGNLIHINHLGLQNYIYKWINTVTYNQSIWIGLHDMRSEGHFEWVSGEQ